MKFNYSKFMLCNDFMTLQNCHFVYDTIYSDSDFLLFLFKKKFKKKTQQPSEICTK
jgi:hypothetical protein